MFDIPPIDKRNKITFIVCTSIMIMGIPLGIIFGYEYRGRCHISSVGLSVVSLIVRIIIPFFK